MRSLPAADAKLYSLRDRSVALKITIAGTDVTNLAGRDWVVGFSYSGSVEDPLAGAELELARDEYEVSLAPLNAASKLNQVGGVYSPLLALNALVVASVAIVPAGDGRAYADAMGVWREVFRGRIDDIDAADNPIKIKLRDIGCEIADAFIERELAYAIGRKTSGVDVWTAGMPVVAGQLVVPSQIPSLADGPSRVYMTDLTGETGVTEPTWPTDYSTSATDGTARWWLTAFGAGAWAASTAFTLGDVIYASGGDKVICTRTGTSGATEPTWPAEGTAPVGTSFGDGTTRWSMLPATSDGGIAIEAIIAGVLKDNCGIFSVPELYTPTSPTYWRNPLIVSQQSTLEAMRALALEIGWDVRTVWAESTSEHATWGKWRPTFYSPDRVKTTADLLLSADQYTAIPRLEQNVATIRNVVEVWYSDWTDRWADGNPKRKSYKTIDSASKDRYRRRYFGLGAGTANNINSATEAEALAAACLSDLAEPLVDAEVRGPYLWHVEVGDLLEIGHDDFRFTENQKLAVVAYQHDPVANETVLQCRGKPTIGVRRWLERAAGAVPAQGNVNPGGPAVSSIDATESFEGVHVEFAAPVVGPVVGPPRGGAFAEAELHLSTTSGFTPSAATLKARGRATGFDVTGLPAGTTQYARICCIDACGRRSAPSEEFSFTPPKLARSDGGVGFFVVTGGIAALESDSVMDAPGLIELTKAQIDPGSSFSETSKGFSVSGNIRVTAQIEASGLALGNTFRAVLKLDGTVAAVGPWLTAKKDIGGTVRFVAAVSSVLLVGSTAKVLTLEIERDYDTASSSLTALADRTFLGWQRADEL